MPTFDTLLQDSFSLDTAEMLQAIDKFQLTEQQKAVVMTSIVLEKLGAQKRVFSYAQALAAAMPDCRPVFERSFVHDDWQDGEDVVSAEGANGDEGFNARFHKIEGDLDALGADIARSFACLADLRAQLAVMLQELRTEINRINAELHDLKPKTGGGMTIAPEFFPPEWFQPQPEPYPGWRFREPIPGLVSPDSLGGFNRGLVNQGLGIGGRLINPVGPHLAGQPFLGQEMGGVWTLRGNPQVGVIAGMRAEYVTEGTFNGDKVEVWNTPIGTLMTAIDPKVEAGGGQIGGYVHPKAELVGHVGAWIATHSENIKAEFDGEPFTKADLDRVFGGEFVAGGVRLKDAMTGIPATEKFETPTAVVDKVAETQAQEIVKTGAGTVAGMGLVGLQVGEAKPAEAAIESFQVMSFADREALSAAGFRTVKDVAAAEPGQLAQAIAAAQNISAGQAELAAGRMKGLAAIVGYFR